MYKQLKQIMLWFSRKRILLFVFILLMAQPVATIFFFEQKNKLIYPDPTVFILLSAGVLLLLLIEIVGIQKINQVLKLQKEHYSIILSNIQEGLITTDKSGQVNYMNFRAEQLTGWSSIEAKNKPLHKIYNVVNEETGEPFEHIMNRILKGGKKIEWENNTILKSKSSASIIISNSASPIFDSHGLIAGAVLVFNDITEKYKIEKELKESEQQYRNLIEQASDAILIYSFDGIIYEFNKACYTMLGYSKEEYSKLKLNDIIAGEIVENQENYEAILKGATKTIYRYLKCKDGSLLEAEVSVKMLANGKAIAFARDITERKKAERAIKESEEKYRTLIEQASDAIFINTQSGAILEINDSAASLVGCTKEKLLKMNVIDLFTKAELLARPIMNKELLAGERTRIERNIQHDNGSEIPVEITGKMLSDGRIMAIIRDITKRKKAEQSIKKEKDLLEYVINSLPGIFYLLDENVNFLHWNKNFEIATGYNAAEIAVMHPLDFFDVDEKNVIAEKIGEVLMKGEVNLEASFYTKERKKVPYYLTGFKIEYDGKTHLIGIGLNITERKKAELALAESENYLRTIVQAEPECVKILNSKAELEDINPAGLAMIEADSIMQVKGKSVLGIIDEPYRNAFTLLTNEIFNGNAGKLEFKITGLKGTQRWLETHAVPLKNAEGGISSLLSVTRDITERKNAEEAIIKEKEISDSIINSMPGVFYFYDENLKLLRWNKQFETVTGYSASEIAKKNPADFFTGTDKEYMKAISRKVFVEGSGSAAASFTTKAGEEIPFYFTGLRMLYEGKPSLLGIGIDMTEHRNAEIKTKKAIERYDILARATSDTIWDWDIVNNKMLYNDGIFKMFGYKASEIENVVDWWNEKLHPEDHVKVQRLLDNIFKNKLQRFQFTYRFRCADGSYKYIFDRAFVLFDDEDKPGRMIGAMQDITYQKEEEIRIGKAIIHAQETERHEIGMELHDNVNQVLSTSLLYLGMATEKQGNNTKAIDSIESGRKYIGEAINEIRRLSHMLAPASFNEAFLKEDFESLINAININNLFTIQLHFEPFEKNTVSYEIQINLYRILQEQLNNIIKYAEATTVAIDVTLINQSIRLRIADNGKGFDVKTAKNGNGLRNMQRRAKLFAGEVTVYSAPGNGCEIIITLPLNDEG